MTRSQCLRHDQQQGWGRHCALMSGIGDERVCHVLALQPGVLVSSEDGFALVGVLQRAAVLRPRLLKVLRKLRLSDVA